MDEPLTPRKHDAPSDGWPEVEQLEATSGTLPDQEALTEIRRLNRRLREAEEQAAALEASTSYRLGRSLVETARSPRRVTRLGRELVRLWRSRAGHAGTRRPPGPRTEFDSRAAWLGTIRARPERALVAHSEGGVGPRTKLVVAGIVSEATAVTLAPDVRLHRLDPHDALVLLERADPDLVLIETGAFGAGCSWAYTGSPGTPDRLARLLEILDAARAMGRPTVLWWTRAAPEPVGIWPLRDRFDLVLDAAGSEGTVPWTAGVQLAQFNDLDLDPRRGGAPIFVGAWDRRLAADRSDRFEELLRAALGRGLEIELSTYALDGRTSFPAVLRSAIRGRVDPAHEADLYRSHAVVIAEPRADGLAADRAGAAMACGARVIGLPAPGVAGLPDEAYRIVERGAADKIVAAALEAGPLGPEAIRRVSRHVYEVHAVPVRLSRLAAHLGLRADPLAERRITVVVGPGRGRPDIAGVVGDLLGQTRRPQTVRFSDGTGDDLDAAGRTALADAGINVEATTGAGDGWPWSRIAAVESGPWIAPWDRTATHGPHYLLDLALAAEASRADVVGYVAQGPARFVPDLMLTGSMMRQEVLEALGSQVERHGRGDLAAAGRKGLRLFGIQALEDGIAAS